MLLAVVIVVGALYFGREIFIPFALALLFSFLLAPAVNRLRHWHVPRVPAVLIVVLLAFAVAGSIGGLMVSQLTDLAGKLPQYQQNIRHKVEALTPGDGGVLGRVNRVIQELHRDLSLSALSGTQTQQARPEGATQPVPVEIRESQFSPMHILRTVLGSIVGMLATAFVVIVFLIFMLVEREDLRDRIIRLAGTGRLHVTTQLLDDASQRVSRYLVVQLIVNVSFGLVIGLGLLFIGVPNPLLWGVIAGLLRYIPYAGTWIAASMPFALAVAVDPGWTKPLLVAGLWLVVEITVANVVEPWVYGASAGITPLAVLVAALFWTWLWGPVGLLLSTPLTVCLVSLGRYISNFEFLYILLGDEPVLSPAARFYQRMLAEDQTEATDLAEEFLEQTSLQELYDRMIIPALVMAERDRNRGALEEHKHRSILRNTKLLVEELGVHCREMKAKAEAERAQRSGGAGTPPAPVPEAAEPAVLCIPARLRGDEITAIMLAQVLEQKGVATRIVSTFALTAEKVEMTKALKGGLVCVSALPPTGLLNARHVCKRLRTVLPEIRIIVGFWHGKDWIGNLAKQLPMVPPDNVVTSLKQAVERILPMVSLPGNDAGQAAPF